MSIDLLVVDPHERDRQGIAGYFTRMGLRVTETADAREGHTLLRDRFFALVLVDIDIEPWGGLDFVAHVRSLSPRSEVALMTTRRAWDVAIGGYRGGAADVVFKDPSDAPRLRELAERVVRRWSGSAEAPESLAAESKSVLDDMLARLLELSQHVPATQSRLAAMVKSSVRVAVVDHEPPVQQALAAVSAETRGGAFAFEVLPMPSGGAALDMLSGSPPDVLVTRDDLFDLPGATLIAALDERASDMLAIVYRGPGAGGEATVFEGGHAVRTIRPFDELGPLVKEVRTMVERATAALEHRRLMDLFRMEHSDLLRRYGVLRARLDEAARASGG
ncbi:MAG: response regulator [Acidobacteria bacterium]|nr:response regulator [Acidobacteriota bacterium]